MFFGIWGPCSKVGVVGSLHSGLLCLPSAILLLLAYLQYRWIAEASEALMERRRRSSRFVLFTAIIAPGPLSQCKLAGSLRSALTQAPLRGS